MSKIDEQIQRIKAKLQEYKGPKRLRPCLSEQEVAAFEAEYRVRLPEEFRRFLLEIGNGESFRPNGPEQNEYNSTWLVYGIKFSGMPNWMNLSEFWEYLSQQPTQYNYGKLLLCDCGCDSYYYLMVTGRERGNVWDSADEYSARIEPPSDFLSWYEKLVDERIEAQGK